MYCEIAGLAVSGLKQMAEVGSCMRVSETQRTSILRFQQEWPVVSFDIETGSLRFSKALFGLNLLGIETLTDFWPVN